jgi:hypothetical protein
MLGILGRLASSNESDRAMLLAVVLNVSGGLKHEQFIGEWILLSAGGARTRYARQRVPSG